MPERQDDETWQLSELVGEAYDASLDPGLWPSVLAKLCRYARGTMANLFSQDVVNHKASRFFTWGGDPYYLELYVQRYAALNPLFPRGLAVPLGEVMTQTDLMPLAEYRQTRFYQEWAKPQGYVDFAAINIEKVASSAASLAVVRHEREGMVDAAMRRRMRLIAPHIRRALLIGKVIDLNRVRAETFADTVDRLTSGVFLVDGAGRLIHANSSGRAMLEARQPVRLADDAIVATDRKAGSALSAALEAAAAGELVLDAGGIVLGSAGAEDGHFVAQVLPLGSGARREVGLAAGAVAALFVRKAGIDLARAVDAAAKLYGLTPAEARVLQGVMQTRGVAAASGRLKISASAVKRHLEHVFVKTGCKRQADLAKLIAGFDISLNR